MAKRVDDAVAQSRQSLAGIASGLEQLTNLAGQAANPSRAGGLQAHIPGVPDQPKATAMAPKRPMSSQLRKQSLDGLNQGLSQEMLEQLAQLADQLGEGMGE